MRTSSLLHYSILVTYVYTRTSAAPTEFRRALPVEAEVAYSVLRTKTYLCHLTSSNKHPLLAVTLPSLLPIKIQGTAPERVDTAKHFGTNFTYLS